LYVASEESPHQILRNACSIGLDLKPWTDKGLLRFHSVRPTFYSLEMHLAVLHKLINEFKPRIIVVDPITNFLGIGTDLEVKAMLTRLIDFLKLHQITGMFTSLTSGSNGNLEYTTIGISSLMDSWLLLRDIEIGGERNRGLYVLKSRGMAHSNQIREFLLTDRGIDLVDVYLGEDAVLTGTARRAQEARERETQRKRESEIDRKQREVEVKRKSLEAKIASLRAEFESEKAEIEKSITEEREREQTSARDRQVRARLRKAENSNGDAKRLE
jgi:circadian clock protein KaiC